jgi:4-hydroxyproline epimerase
LRIDIAHVAKLTEVTWKIRQVINSGGYPEIDHVELFGPPTLPHADSRNFVLCPGKAYDRSACGTGTSAKLACLAADGHLRAGDVWVQESVIGSRFEARWQPVEGVPGDVLPAITGRAWITAQSTLLRADDDPFRDGIRR